jgi:hypothetical protein
MTGRASPGQTTSVRVIDGEGTPAERLTALTR